MNITQDFCSLMETTFTAGCSWNCLLLSYTADCTGNNF